MVTGMEGPVVIAALLEKLDLPYDIQVATKTASEHGHRRKCPHGQSSGTQCSKTQTFNRMKHVLQLASRLKFLKTVEMTI